MIVRSLEHAKAVAERFKLFDYFVFDTETKSKTEVRDDALVYRRTLVTIWSICHRGEAYSFPTSEYDRQFPSMWEIAKLFKPLFADKRRIKVAHNFKYDRHVLDYYGITFPGKIWDTMLGAWAANANIEKGLKSRAPLYGRFQMENKNVDFNNLAAFAEYSEQDVIVTDELYQMQLLGEVKRPEYIEYLYQDGEGRIRFKHEKNGMPVLRLSIKEETLEPFAKIFLELQEIPVLRATIRSEVRGIRFSRKRIRKIRYKLFIDLAAVRKEIFKFAGRVFNLNSPKQLIAVLEELGVNLPDKTKGGQPSVAYASLFKIQKDHPIVAALIKFSQLDKLLSYATIDGLEHFVGEDGRIHASNNTVGARTGRFCVVGSTLIVTDKGEVPIKNIVDKTMSGAKVLVNSHKGNLKKVTKAFDVGFQKVIRVRTKDGKEIVGTPEHKLLTSSGWVALANLRPGDKVFKLCP